MCKKNEIICNNDLKEGGWAEVITIHKENGNKAELIFENLPSWYQIVSCNAYYIKNNGVNGGGTYSNYDTGKS